MTKYLYFILIILFSCDIDKETERESLISEAQKKVSVSDFEGALRFYNEILNQDDTVDYKLITKRAECKYELGDYIGAIEDCSIALDKNENVRSYSIRANSYEKIEEYDKAINDYSKAISINPQSKKLLNNRGSIYLSLGNFEKALADFNSAILIDSNVAIFYNNRGLAYENLQQYQNALSDYNKSIDLDENYTSTYFNRGVCLMYLEKFSEAISDFDRILETKINSNGDVFHNKAIALYSLHDKEQACIEWKNAMNKGNKEALYYFNKVCVQ